MAADAKVSVVGNQWSVISDRVSCQLGGWGLSEIFGAIYCELVRSGARRGLVEI